MAPSSSPFEDKTNASTSDRERRETERLAALDHLDAVRPEVDSVLQQLVDDVREAFGTDLCMVNLVLSNVQYFKAWSGELPEDLAEARQAPRERSMCQYVVEAQKPLVVEDFLATEKFKDQHFRVRYGIRFYAGTPLFTSEGHAIGTLCLLDTQPKEISEEQMTLLEAFAKAVVGRLELLGALRREQTVREDEARRGRELQLTLDSSQDVIATLGADGTFKTINQAVERVLGYEAEELVGRYYLNLVHPEDRDLSTKLTDVIEDGTRECRFENRWLHKDGDVVCIEWNVTVIPEEDVAHCVGRDVTESQRAQEELHKSEARHRAVVETAEDAILTMTTNGMIYSFNPGAERTFGYKAEEVIGQPLRMLMPERFRGPHEAGFRRYLETGEAHVVGKGPIELAGLRKNGEEFPLELTLGELREEDDILFTGIIRDVTGRKRIELALRENEKRFRQFFDQSVDALFIHDISGRIVDCNEEACRSLGYTREELLSFRIRDLANNLVSDEDKRSRAEPTLWQRALSGEPGKVAGVHQGEHRRKDGTTFPVEVYVGSVDYGGERMIFASARDVTERRRAEDELRSSEARLRALFAAMDDIILVIDAQGRYLEIAPTNPSLLYKPPEEIIGKTLHEVFPKEQADAFLGRIRRALETQSAVEMEYSLPIGEEEAWFAGTISPMQEDQVIFVARDITERKRAEEASSVLAAIVESSDDAILGKTLGGIITSWNSGAERLYGYTAEEAVGRHISMLVPPDRPNEVPEILNKLERGESIDHLESVRVTKYGRRLDVSLTISPIKDPGGNVIGASTIARDISERKRAEKEILETSSRLATLIESLQAGILVEDDSRHILHTNQEFCAMFGIPASSQTLIGMDCSESTEESKELFADPEGFVRHIEEVLNERRPVTGEELALADGRTFERDYVPIFVGDYYRGHLWQYRDITERKRTEEEIRQLNETLELRVEERTEELEIAVAELKESEERYSLVVEGSNDGIWDWDIRTGELYWSDRFLKILGLSGSGFVPTFERFSDLLHPDDRQRVLDAVKAHLDHDSEFNEEFRMRHSSGGYVYCVSRGKAIRDADGVPIRMAGVITDITERKRSEEALSFLAEASAELASSLDYHTTLASVARLTVPRLADWCAVDVLEEDGSLNRIAVAHENPEKVRWARELQERYPPDTNASYGVAEVLRTGEPELVPEIPESLLDEAATDDQYREILRELGLKSYMVVPLAARGRMLGAITFVTSESGRRYGPEDLELAEELARWAELAVDNARLYDSARTELAEREQAEEEVRRLNESLERRVEERTRQLEEAREAAEAANRAKSDFLANMSHEIRTPMNGIIGMTELLFDTELSEEQREYAETVHSSSEALLTIINDILDFSKIEAGKMRIEATDFDLQTVVEEVVGLFAERADDKGLELASLVEYGLPTALRGDPGRLRQVLTNLISNALKFTEEGEIVLHVDLEVGTEDTVVLRFEVTDSGIGIDPELRERLFQSFSQADASTTRRYGGTGLGLAISKQLVELMGGEIGVESEPGVGSTFWFTAPLEKQPEETQTVPRPFVANLHDLRVLIVDDNATNRRILNRQIAPWSMHSESAEDGPKALQILRAAAERGAAYDLAILDMQMPGMDGMQLARAIKADPAISVTRLILLTSVGKRGDGEEAREAGIEAYLTKPVKQSELYDTIAAVMGAPTEAETPREKQLVTRHSLREKRARLLPRVLVAEDNPVNQKVATLMLEKLGYGVDVATNGVEALEALSQRSYAAVLMDVQMPEMGGYEATAEIRRREEPEDRHTPIIAMTANAMQGDREKALESGMDDYVSKPVKREELGDVLERWAQRETSKEIGAPDGSGAFPAGNSASPTAPASAVAQEEDSQNPLDESVLEGLRELGDASLLTELVELFVGETPSRLTALRDAVEGEDAGAVEQTAHALKGSCSNMGAWRMANLCAELQKLDRSGDLTLAPELLDHLRAEFDRVRAALEDQTK